MFLGIGGVPKIANQRSASRSGRLSVKAAWLAPRSNWTRPPSASARCMLLRPWPDPNFFVTGGVIADGDAAPLTSGRPRMRIVLAVPCLIALVTAIN